MIKGPQPRPPIDRFMEKWRTTIDGCWFWEGGTNGKYGLFFPGGGRTQRNVYAHRWSYEHFVGPIPEGLVIDHLCRVPRCVNPHHLEVVTPYENFARGRGLFANRARSDTCKHGHPLDRIRPDGRRRCSTCGRLIQRRAVAKRKASPARVLDR